MSALFLNTDLIEINSFKKQPVAVWEHEIVPLSVWSIIKET